MATYTREFFSVLPSGAAIPIASVAAPGTPVHAGINSGASCDEVYAWFSNITTTPCWVTVEWGGSSDADAIVKRYTLPANSSPIPLVTGQVLKDGRIMRVHAQVANAVNVTGYINRITQ